VTTTAYARTTLRGTVTRGGEPLARADVQLRDGVLLPIEMDPTG
jgi:hypothetical protein